MKSAHRHELETNALAHRLELYIERYRPYASRIVGAVLALIAVILVWSYISASSATRRSETWDTFNRAVSAMPPNLDEMHRTAQEFPNTPMQEMADVTWADGQVWQASRNYLGNRAMAKESLDRATSAYQGVLNSSRDERLTSRARLGLARVYEMQNQLDKAREEYRKVGGTFAEYAQKQAERLEKPDVQDTFAWLATAQPPRVQATMGPGTPGKPPEFSPGEIALPNTGGPQSGTTGAGKGTEDAIDNLFKNLKLDPKLATTPDRYGTEDKSKNGATPPPASDGVKTDASKDEKAAEPPAKAPADEGRQEEKSPPPGPPAPEKSAK